MWHLYKNLLKIGILILIFRDIKTYLGLWYKYHFFAIVYNLVKRNSRDSFLDFLDYFSLKQRYCIIYYLFFLYREVRKLHFNEIIIDYEDDLTK